MTAVQTVRVKLGPRSYNIDIGTNCLPELGNLLGSSLSATTHVVVVTDNNVKDTHAALVMQSLRKRCQDIDLFSLTPGEQSKSVDTANSLWQQLLACRADRRSMVVAVGGGVVGDIAGFAAATYARGLDFVQVPTTLLAQVDSSVGGKVGINLSHAKNMVGAFWQPKHVAIDTLVLKTMPDREYRAGLAEVVKYGMILDHDFFEFLEQNVTRISDRDDEALRFVVARSCQLKAEVVEADEHELSGARTALNYGHTFGHALEVAGRYEALLHGEAVAIGMCCAAHMAVSLGLIDDQIRKRQHKILAAFGLPVQLPEVNLEAVISAMKHDKKAEKGEIRFVLPTRIGNVKIVDDVDPGLIRESLMS